MSTSTATVSPQYIPLSPMRVTFNGVDLGGTTNSVKIKKVISMADIMVDQYGKTSIDKVVSGYNYEISFVLAEVKYKPNWKVVYASDKLVTSGPNQSVISDMQIGDHLYAKALPLILHPLEMADGDLSADYNFEKVVSIQTSEVDYGPEKQTGLAVTLHVFPNLNVSPARFMVYGDPAVGAIPASAAAAVAGANTGNGTLDTIAVFSGVTPTETITATCLDGGVGGNNFVVSGSISGALGYLHISATSSSTSNFVPTSGSPQVITFTLHQGTIQYVAGDSFTIATTAANYV